MLNGSRSSSSHRATIRYHWSHLGCVAALGGSRYLRKNPQVKPGKLPTGEQCLKPVPPRELTYPMKVIFEDEFPFPKVGYVNSLEGICTFYLIILSFCTLIFYLFRSFKTSKFRIPTLSDSVPLMRPTEEFSPMSPKQSNEESFT